MNHRSITVPGHGVATSDLPRVVILASGAGSTCEPLLRMATGGRAGMTVAAVVTDRRGAPVLGRAREHGLATATVLPADFASRPAWDAGLTEAVKVFRPDLVVSAGFMRILCEPFLTAFPGRIVNMHPALLPSFPGANAVADAVSHGVRITGCTMHVVDAGVDTGPIIAQRAVPVAPEDDETSLHEKIKQAERSLLCDEIPRLAALAKARVALV